MPCPICNSSLLKPVRAISQETQEPRDLELYQCETCLVIFTIDYKKSRSSIYESEEYAAWGKSTPEDLEEIGESKKDAFRAQLKPLLSQINPEGKKALDVGTGFGYLMQVAEEKGFAVWGLDPSPVQARSSSKKFPARVFQGDLSGAEYESDFFDVVFLTDVLEHLPDPEGTLKEIQRILKPGGWLFIISPDSDSLSRWLFGKKWFQYKYEHLFYFNRCSLDYLLAKTGFALFSFQPNRKKFTPAYYYHYFEKYSFSWFGRFFRRIYKFLPHSIKHFSFSNPMTGEFLALARKNTGTDLKSHEII